MSTVVTHERQEEIDLEAKAELALGRDRAIKRHRAAFRIYCVLAVLAFGAIVNSLLWLMGRAREYQYLPYILLVAALVYGTLRIIDR